jgi:hypothetical protein
MIERRIARCRAVKSSLKRCRALSTASRLLRKMSRHMTGSVAALIVTIGMPARSHIRAMPCSTPDIRGKIGLAIENRRLIGQNPL